MSTTTNNDFIRAAINQLESMRTARQQLNNKIDELVASRNQLEQQVSALQNYLATVEEKTTDQVQQPTDNPQTTNELEPWMRHRLDPELVKRVYDILDKRGREQMHYKEIVQEIADSGWPFTDNPTSRGAWVNRVLNGDNRFVRPSRRGYYSIRKHYPNVTRNVGERRR